MTERGSSDSTDGAMNREVQIPLLESKWMDLYEIAGPLT